MGKKEKCNCKTKYVMSFNTDVHIIFTVTLVIKKWGSRQPPAITHGMPSKYFLFQYCGTVVHFMTVMTESMRQKFISTLQCDCFSVKAGRF